MAYLHNRRVHCGTMCTPFESWYSRMPQLQNLRVFGSRVFVKQLGARRAKLGKHDFTGIFLGYTATDANIRYVDTSTSLVKTSHHATRPPVAQLLYDLGIQLASTTPDPDIQIPIPVVPLFTSDIDDIDDAVDMPGDTPSSPANPH